VYQRIQHELADLFSSDVPDFVLTHFFGESFQDSSVWHQDSLIYTGISATQTTVALTGLSGGVLYEFVVGATSASGEADRSAPVVQSTAPPAPLDLVVNNATSSSVSVSWTPPVTPSGEVVTGYHLYRDDGLGGQEITTSAYYGADNLAVAVEVQGLAGGRTYQFAVKALSAAGVSSDSIVAEGTTT
jgi:hypothetical protein